MSQSELVNHRATGVIAQKLVGTSLFIRELSPDSKVKESLSQLRGLILLYRCLPWGPGLQVRVGRGGPR